AFRAALIERLRQRIAEVEHVAGEGVSLHLTGVAVQKHDVSYYVSRDQAVLMPLAVLTLAGMLAIFFRAWIGVALPLAVTGISVATTLGCYHLAGLRLNAITALLPPVIMVLSVAVSVHLVQRWRQLVGELEPERRIRRTVSELFFPCFFCSLTTALGFVSLAVAELPAVRQFGIFAAVGVLVSFLAGMTLVPAALSFLSPPSQLPRSATHRWLRALLEAAAETATRYPIAIVAIFLAITAIAAAGVPLIRNNTDLIRFLKPDAPLFRDTMFIDAHLTGANAIELMIRRADGMPFGSLEDITRLERYESSLRQEPQITTVISILSVLRQLARAERGDDALRLPDNERDLGYLFDLLAGAEQPLVNKLLSDDHRTLRMSLRVRAVGTAVTAPLAEEIQQRGQVILGPEYRVTPTGAFYYIARDSNRLVRDQVSSFGLSLIAVFCAVGLLLRSIKPTLVSLVPNVMPIVWTGGLMGFLDIDLSTGTAMIASAVIGLVVDDTIHYLAGYYRSYDGDAAAAVHETTTGIGAALVMNNLVLVFGFWVGAFGSFLPTIYFSLLSGLTMITAMVCDLFVTPACLVLLDRRRREVTA
ncbi:MAG TPA: MMPL family transporter, partial [Terriglobales bacterium]|nr:MMPL family transporter [Terriglobales bacterium]